MNLVCLPEETVFKVAAVLIRGGMKLMTLPELLKVSVAQVYSE